MRGTISLDFDTTNEKDRRFLRELNALFGSVSYISLDTANDASTNTTEGDDDETSTAPATVQPGEVDAEGFPWDERIHSGGKTKSEKGVWRSKKGVSDTVKNTVIAELRSLGYGAVPIATGAPIGSAPAVPVTASTIQTGFPIPAPQPVAAPAPQPVAAPAPQPVPVAAPMPQPVAAPAPQPVPVAAPAIDFPTVMAIINNAATANPPLIDGGYLAWLCQTYQLGDNVVTLAPGQPNHHRLAEVYAQLKVDIEARGGKVA